MVEVEQRKKEGEQRKKEGEEEQHLHRIRRHMEQEEEDSKAVAWRSVAAEEVVEVGDHHRIHMEEVEED